jgi:hypothetical protein
METAYPSRLAAKGRVTVTNALFLQAGPAHHRIESSNAAPSHVLHRSEITPPTQGWKEEGRINR